MTRYLVTAFVAWLQNRGIYLCAHPIGETPRPLTAEEAISLKNEFCDWVNL